MLRFIKETHIFCSANDTPEEFDTKGGLSAVCTQIMLKSLYFASIGRTNLLRSRSTFARFRHKVGQRMPEKSTEIDSL